MTPIPLGNFEQQTTMILQKRAKHGRTREGQTKGHGKKGGKHREKKVNRKPKGWEGRVEKDENELRKDGGKCSGNKEIWRERERWRA